MPDYERDLDDLGQDLLEAKCIAMTPFTEEFLLEEHRSKNADLMPHKKRVRYEQPFEPPEAPYIGHLQVDYLKRLMAVHEG